MTTSRTWPWSTSLSNCENEMSWEEARWPGFWNSVNNAKSNRTMMTQRAKLRRLAFIDFPSWSRESRPLSFRTYPWVATRESPPRPHCNLGAARLAAKGTSSDYLAHPDTIPVQKMTIEAAFSGVVKTPGGTNSQTTVLFAAL